ncbi:MAG: NAD-dependent epimerase/dehydratase family protein [Helicobacteraceae bacterium]|jgi:CDP-glucose 4,6-dehydratase|nr:NAD-dependent epimerase/dehydratase family protein [Helicobacteraceae bacterium]
MRFLITGHTGFVGAWTALFLRELGHTVCGLALEPARFNIENAQKVLKECI